jgi:hypothetical protein
MTRVIVLFSLVLAACDVGDASNGQNSIVDSGVKHDSGSGSNVDAAPVAAHVHTAPLQAGNPSNAGNGCLSANCHGAVTPAGPTFAFAGTVYTTIDRNAPAPGVLVTAGTLTATTDTAGNFYAYSPPLLTFPCNASVTTSVMSGALTAGGGDCNSSGCHQQPGGTQQGIYK